MTIFSFLFFLQVLFKIILKETHKKKKMLKITLIFSFFIGLSSAGNNPMFQNVITLGLFKSHNIKLIIIIRKIANLFTLKPELTATSE
jgi:hypothetical protein